MKQFVKLISKKEGKISLLAKDDNIPKLVSIFEILKRAHSNQILEEHEILIKKLKTATGWEEISMEIPLCVKNLWTHTITRFIIGIYPFASKTPYISVVPYRDSVFQYSSPFQSSHRSYLGSPTILLWFSGWVMFDNSYFI